MIIQPKTRRGNYVGKQPERLSMLGLTIGLMDEDEHETIRTAPSVVQEGLMLECVAVHPKSSKNKTVYLLVPPSQIVPLMKELKEWAIMLRSTPMNSEEG